MKLWVEVVLGDWEASQLLRGALLPLTGTAANTNARKKKRFGLRYINPRTYSGQNIGDSDVCTTCPMAQSLLFPKENSRPQRLLWDITKNLVILLMIFRFHIDMAFS